MPLRVVELRDLRDFTQDYLTAVGVPGLAGASIFNTVSTGWNMGVGDGREGSVKWWSIYNYIRDEIVFICNVTKETTLGATALKPSLNARDALCRNSSVGFWKEGDTLYGGLGSFDTAKRLVAGQPNVQAGTQKIYFDNPNAGGYHTLNPITGGIETDTLFTNILTDWRGNDLNPLVAGEWAAGTGGNPEQRSYNPVLFEGITDSTDYQAATEDGDGIFRGGTSHTQGLCLIQAQVSNFSGTNRGERWIWVDLATGEAVGTLDIPSQANSTSTNVKAESSIDGRNFAWRIPQFVPDPESTFARPKGELHISSTESDAREIAGTTISSPEEADFTSLVTRNYVTVYDFNPFGEQTGTVRVHNRRIFLGIIDVPQEPVFPAGFNATNANSGFQERCTTMIYHPPSRTYIVTCGHPPEVNSDEPDDPVAGHSRIIRFRRETIVSRISQPTPETAVTESRSIRARVVASTDTTQRAVGATVNFTLTRRSTRAETFDGAVVGAGTYTVDADVIDEDSSLDVRSGNDVDSGGTLLVETTDYTVNYATGVLTPVGSWPSADIYVRYRHRSVGLTPPHGTLINASAVTDGDGEAFATIRYGANADGELDNLSATA